MLSIGYIFHGTKVVRDTFQEIHYTQGDIFCLGFGRHDQSSIPDHIGYVEYVVELSREELCSIVGFEKELFYGDDFPSSATLPNHAGCRAGSTLRSFFGELATRPDGNTLRQKRLLIMLLVEFADRSVVEWLSRSIDTRTSSFLSVVYDNILNDCSLEHLASQYNCSLTTFKSIFSQHFHCSPHKWFVHQRLEYARRLLEITDMSVAEVGLECKFANASYFVKAFHRAYDITPQAYRLRASNSAREAARDEASCNGSQSATSTTPCEGAPTTQEGAPTAVSAAFSTTEAPSSTDYNLKA